MGTAEGLLLLKLTRNPIRPLELRVDHLLRRCLQPGLTATVTATATNHATATGHTTGVAITLVISHPVNPNTPTAEEDSVKCSQHPVKEVLALSGGSLASVSQGYQVTCPRCGRASNVLHTHQHVQQALTTTHISPSTGAPCAYLQSQSGQLLSTGPCFKGSLPSTAGLLHGQHVDAPQLTSRQHDDPIPVEPQAVRLMGLILAQIALDVAATSQAASQGKPLAGKAQDTGIEASLRAWAIRVLTQDLKVIECANYVRPSFETLIHELTKPPSPITATAAPASSAPPAPPPAAAASAPPTTFRDTQDWPVSLLDLLLAPPWATPAERDALETSSLERTAVLLRFWLDWLQENRPADARAGLPGLSNDGYMQEARMAGLRRLLVTLLSRDCVFGEAPAGSRLELFFECAGVKGKTVDEALKKLDKTIRTKPHLTTHVEACAYCGLSSRQLQRLCKGRFRDIMCKCAHDLVTVCVPCVLTASGKVPEVTGVACGSIGQAEAAAAAAEWPRGLCPWCQQSVQEPAAALPDAAAAATATATTAAAATATAPAPEEAAAPFSSLGCSPFSQLVQQRQHQQPQQHQHEQPQLPPSDEHARAARVPASAPQLSFWYSEDLDAAAAAAAAAPGQQQQEQQQGQHRKQERRWQDAAALQDGSQPQPKKARGPSRQGRGPDGRWTPSQPEATLAAGLHQGPQQAQQQGQPQPQPQLLLTPAVPHVASPNAKAAAQILMRMHGAPTQVTHQGGSNGSGDSSSSHSAAGLHTAERPAGGSFWFGLLAAQAAGGANRGAVSNPAVGNTAASMHAAAAAGGSILAGGMPFSQQLAQAGNAQAAAQGQHLPHSQLMTPSTAAQLLQEEVPVRPDVPAASPVIGSAGVGPAALLVTCNGNPRIYLQARQGMQCMCLPCQAQRPMQPQADWVMSPTQFERHSGLPSHKNCMRSIHVTHAGEPGVPLGRWLELTTICRAPHHGMSFPPNQRGCLPNSKPQSMQDGQLQAQPLQAAAATWTAEAEAAEAVMVDVQPPSQGCAASEAAPTEAGAEWMDVDMQPQPQPCLAGAPAQVQTAETAVVAAVQTALQAVAVRLAARQTSTEAAATPAAHQEQSAQQAACAAPVDGSAAAAPAAPAAVVTPGGQLKGSDTAICSAPRATAAAAAADARQPAWHAYLCERLMQELLASGDAFARHVGGMLALGVAAGIQRQQQQQDVGCAASGVEAAEPAAGTPAVGSAVGRAAAGGSGQQQRLGSPSASAASTGRAAGGEQQHPTASISRGPAGQQAAAAKGPLAAAAAQWDPSQPAGTALTASAAAAAMLGEQPLLAPQEQNALATLLDASRFQQLPAVQQGRAQGPQRWQASDEDIGSDLWGLPPSSSVPVAQGGGLSPAGGAAALASAGRPSNDNHALHQQEEATTAPLAVEAVRQQPAGTRAAVAGTHAKPPMWRPPPQPLMPSRVLNQQPNGLLVNRSSGSCCLRDATAKVLPLPPVWPRTVETAGPGGQQQPQEERL